MSDSLNSANNTNAIRNLLAEYGRLLDLRDARAWAELFTTDGEWVGGERYGIIAGHTALTEFVEREFASTPPCVHILSNMAITLANAGSDCDATAWSRWMLVEQGNDGLKIVLAGNYADILTDTPEGWRFRRREVSVDLPVGA